MSNEIRCAGCGKIIETDEPTNKISAGTLVKTTRGPKFKEKEVWGTMHRSCFNRAIDSPEAVLEEIRASRTTQKKSA